MTESGLYVFLDMVKRCRRVLYSEAQAKDIFEFIRGESGRYCELSDVKVEWKWNDFEGSEYTEEQKYKRNAEELYGALNTRGESLKKIIIALEE